MSSTLEINEGSSRRLTGEAMLLRWRSWPLRDNPQLSLLLLAGLAAVGLVVGWVSAQSHLALGSVGLLAITMWRYFVPIVYELNDSGLERRILGWRLYTSWRAIRRWEAGPDGLLIFQEAEPGLLDQCRAIYVPFGEHAAQILAQFRAQCGGAEIVRAGTGSSEALVGRPPEPQSDHPAGAGGEADDSGERLASGTHSGPNSAQRGRQ